MDRFNEINRMVHLLYPETLEQLIIINVPGIFNVIWRLFVPLCRCPFPQLQKKY
jgi:hypothetical protein